jgi:hypothetical protein
MTEIEKQQIMELRLKGEGYKKIAGTLGISRDSVRNYCKRNMIGGDSDSASHNVEERITNNLFCACCNKPIKQNKGGRARRFCSEGCRRKWWKENKDKQTKSEKATYKFICHRCGIEFNSYGNKRRKYCSHDCYIKDRFLED